jgi:hypothetical protein
MTCTNEPNNHSSESTKSELLPRGDKGKKIIEVLAEMYRSTHKPEHAADNTKDTRASKERMDTEE